MNAPHSAPAVVATSAVGWLARCRDAVIGAGTCRWVRAELDDESSFVHQQLQFESQSQWLTEPEPDADGEIPTPEMATARVILGLAEALVGERDPHFAVHAALGHFDATVLWSAGSQLLGGDSASTTGAGPLATMLRAAVTAGDHPSRGFVMLMLLDLAGRRPATARVTQMPVLFASSGQRGHVGEHGRLTVEVLADGPSGIHPDPAGMSASQAAADTARGIETAWETSELAATGACVVWSVADGDGVPCSRIEGNSMSAAFAVCLDDIARTSWLRRRLRLRTLDRDCAVTAGLQGENLTGVVGYAEKMSVARAQSLRVVVAAADVEVARRAAAPDFVERISGAATLADAIALTRSVRNRSLWATVIALMVVVALAIAGGVVGYQRLQEVNRERLATELAARSADLAGSDSRLAALLALTADRVHSSPTTVAAMRTVADNNESVTASAQVADSAVDFVASYGRIALTAGTSKATRKTLRAWALPALTPLGDISLDGEVYGLGATGYSGSGLAAAVVGSKLEIFQGADGMVPVRVASFDTPFHDHDVNVFGPFVDADTNAVVAFDAQRRGVFWAPGMRTADTFDLTGDIGNSQLVAVSGFGRINRFDESAQQTADTAGATVLLGSAARGLYRLVIDRPKSAARPPATAATGYYASQPDTTRTYAAASMLSSSIGSQIYSLAISNGGAVLVGTDTGLRQFYRDADEADVDKAVKERITAIVVPELFADSLTYVTADGLGTIDEGRVTQSARVDSTQAVRRTVRSVAENSDGTVLTGRMDGSVVLHDPRSSLTRLPELFGATDVGFTSDGEFVMAGVSGKGANAFGSVDVGTPSSKSEGDLAALGPSSGGRALDDASSYRRQGNHYVQVFSVDATAKYVVAAGIDQATREGAIWLWDRSSDDASDVTRALPFQQQSAGSDLDVGRGVALSPDGDTVYGFNPGRGEITAWSSADGSVRWTQKIDMTTELIGLLSSRASFDRARGRAVIDYYGPDRKRRHALVDLADGRVRDLNFLADYDDALISPDGRLIAASHENTLAVFGVDGSTHAPPTNLGGIVGNLAFNDDQTRIVTDLHGTGQLLFLSTRTLTETAPRWRLPGLGPSDYATGLAWSRDGRFLAVDIGTNQRDQFFRTKSVRILRADRIDMTAALCAIAGSELTADEWRRLVGDTEQFAVCGARR